MTTDALLAEARDAVSIAYEQRDGAAYLRALSRLKHIESPTPGCREPRGPDPRQTGAGYHAQGSSIAQPTHANQGETS